MKILDKGTYILHNSAAKKLVVDIDLDETPELFFGYIYGTMGVESIGLVRSDIKVVTKEENPEYFL